MMRENYLGFLDYRAAQRRLIARFSRPRGLLLHILIFVTTMTTVWAYGIAWRLWYYPGNFMLPMTIGAVWSAALAVHALLHYRRSPAVRDRRELAVEDEMRQFIDQHGSEVDHETLFTMHNQFEAELEQQGRWSLALTAFALVNAVSWLVAAVQMGTSWAFQMTLPLMVLIVGGVNVLLSWQAQRRMGHVGWFTRLPLRHIAAYGAGFITLGLAGMFRMINYWDANNLIVIWGLALLVHVVWSAALWPLVQRFLPAQAPAKRKLANRLELTDDGELADADDDAPGEIRKWR